MKNPPPPLSLSPVVRPLLRIVNFPILRKNSLGCVQWFPAAENIYFASAKVRFRISHAYVFNASGTSLHYIWFYTVHKIRDQVRRIEAHLLRLPYRYVILGTCKIGPAADRSHRLFGLGSPPRPNASENVILLHLNAYVYIHNNRSSSPN